MSGTTWVTWTPPVAPSQNGTQFQQQPRLINNNFGDGYQQVAPDGINFLNGSITLAWGQVRTSDWATITAFLAAHVATPFYWTLPGETNPRQWRAVKWSQGFGTTDWIAQGSADLTLDFSPFASSGTTTVLDTGSSGTVTFVTTNPGAGSPNELWSNDGVVCVSLESGALPSPEFAQVTAASLVLDGTPISSLGFGLASISGTLTLSAGSIGTTNPGAGDPGEFWDNGGVISAALTDGALPSPDFYEVTTDILVLDGTPISGVGAGLTTVSGALSVLFGTSSGDVLGGSLYGAANGVAPLDTGSHLPMANLPNVVTQVWTDVSGTGSIFNQAPVPTPPYPRSGMTISDKLKIAAVFNFGEVWGTDQYYDAYPALQAFLLYCQLMALAMRNTQLENLCQRITVDCYLPRGQYPVSSPVVVPEFVRLTGPGLLVRVPFTTNLSNDGTVSFPGTFYATSATAEGFYQPTVIVVPRGHLGMLNLNVNGNSGSYFYRGSGVVIGRFWAAVMGQPCTIGSGGSGYSVGDLVYAMAPSISPYAPCYMQVTSVDGSGAVLTGVVFNGDHNDGLFGAGAYGLPPAMQITQWTAAKGFSGMFDPARPGYFQQAATKTSALAPGSGTGCSFLPPWAPDFITGNYNYGRDGQGASPLQADTIVQHINITGATHEQYSSTYGPTFGVMITGLNGVIGEISLLGGQYGVYFSKANDWRCGKINPVEANIGILMFAAGSVEIENAVVDTCGSTLFIDQSSRVVVRGMVFFEETNLVDVVYPNTQGAAVKIGASSNAGAPNRHLDVELTLVNMGGVSSACLAAYPTLVSNGVTASTQAAALYLAYTTSSRIKLTVSNFNESGTGTSLLPTQAFVNLGPGVDGSVLLEGVIDGITGPACIGTITSPCDIRVWDSAAQGRAGPFGTYELFGSGAPTNGGSGTGAGKAGVGSTYRDTAAGVIYRNTGSMASPTWTNP